MDNIINKVFPPKCLFCNKNYGSVFCQHCLTECRIVCSTNCLVCDTPSPLNTTHLKCTTAYTPISTFSLFDYNGYVRACIKNSKYSAKQFMALKVLTTYGLQLAANAGYSPPANVIVVSIPLNKTREKTRGFNQAELIAKVYAKHFNLTYAANLLIRTKNTKTQFSNTRAERFTNVQNAFTVHPKAQKLMQQKRITLLVVDDIRTTGATLLEATKCLYAHNAFAVHCFTLAVKPKLPSNAIINS